MTPGGSRRKVRLKFLFPCNSAMRLLLYTVPSYCLRRLAALPGVMRR